MLIFGTARLMDEVCQSHELVNSAMVYPIATQVAAIETPA